MTEETMRGKKESRVADPEETRTAAQGGEEKRWTRRDKRTYHSS